jgi:hypothetical protein
LSSGKWKLFLAKSVWIPQVSLIADLLCSDLQDGILDFADGTRRITRHFSYVAVSHFLSRNQLRSPIQSRQIWNGFEW